MNQKLKTFLQVGLNIAKVMIPQIATVEEIARTIPTLKGKAKADAVIQMSIESLLASEGVLMRDFVHDVKFRAGMTQVNEGLVLIMQAINEREQPAPVVVGKGKTSAR